MNSGCAPMTIAIGKGRFSSLASSSARHRWPRECRLVASSVFECSMARW